MRNTTKATFLWVFVGTGALVHADAVVSLSSNVTTVAKGGTVNFVVTVTPSTYVESVTLSYEGEEGGDVDDAAPFNFSHQFDVPGDDTTVTATVAYTNQDPDGTDSIDIDVVALSVTGTSTPLRCWPTSYIAQSSPAGKSINQFNWTFSWGTGSNTYQDNDADDNDQSSYFGPIIVAGTVSCSAVVSGIEVSGSVEVQPQPRSWAVPISCAQDNESDWGDEPTASAELGMNRDRDSDYGSYIFVPRTSANDWSSAFYVSQVGYGPCSGWWYVSSSSLKIQRETVIDRYIKSDGPTLGGYNFYTVNSSSSLDCFTSSPADFLQAVKNHEYRGTPAVQESIEGHQGRIEWSVLDDDHDAKQHIEALTNRDRSSLIAIVNDVIAADEYAVGTFGLSETYMWTYGPNWGADAGALGDGMNARWDDSQQVWTDCENGPLDF